MEVFEDAEADVEADEVDQLEWAHGVIEAELEGFVDVGGGGDAFLEHVKSFVANHGIDPGGDEAGRFANDHDFLAHALAYFDAGREGGLGSFESANNFEELHFGDGIEEMHADAMFGAESDGGHFGDGEGGSVGGEDGVGLGEFVEESEDFELGFHFLGDGFDGEVGFMDGVLDVLGSFEAGEGLVAEFGG